MISMFKERLFALLYHLVFSFVLTIFLVIVVFIFWFPGVYHVFGAKDGMLIFIGVDIVLGPLLTFVVYKLNKRELVRDLAIILAVQISVFSFGVWTIYQQSPYVQVLTHNNLFVYARDDFAQAKVDFSGFADKGYIGPYKFFMYLPEQLSEIHAVEFASEFIEQKPFGMRVDLYRPYTEGVKWGLKNLLSRFEKDSRHECYWVNLTSKHFVGKSCVDQHGGILFIK